MRLPPAISCLVRGGYKKMPDAPVGAWFCICPHPRASSLLLPNAKPLSKAEGHFVVHLGIQITNYFMGDLIRLANICG